MLRAYAICVYIFLYLPITMIVFFSFNAGKYAMAWEGFSVFWYGKAFSNPLIMGALRTSVIIALSTAILSAIIGTLTALGLERLKGWLRITFDALIYIAIMVPGIVIGISTLIAFVSVFDLVNPSLAGLGIKLQMGTWAVIAAHVLFNIAVVALLVRARLQGMDRSLVDASEDLYATPLGTFRQVVLPLLAPSILAGFLLAFTFSFEDFIIAYFVSGPDTTLPIYIFSSIRRGVTPEINAVGSVVLLTSFVLLIIAQAVLRRGEKTARAS
ncbi:MAG: ABC transporter permease [Alphaproteobacteria bacterium]|uniref:ABC transporter permease n=1 Tax=Aestuariivirga sp. TaxID=2650926 RepID=UPI0030164DDB|nr:ABC transporter permease [Alphaproteobacteria bacterium]